LHGHFCGDTVSAALSTPRITAPVSRSIGAADLDRTVLFWRDVLGFDARSADGQAIDLISGPARVRAGASGWPDSGILFFETDDVEEMHATITRRGGQPTEPENVNWIKMRMFQLQDPDGHVIWFGQSYDVDSPPRPRSMVTRALPELPFDDVPAAVKHYRDVLGFQINYEQHDIGVMYRDDATVLLIARTPQHSGIASAYFYVRDADALYSELLQKGADVRGEPISQPWGLREFSVLDHERNRLTFGQPFE
jgi:uncharacterized glyoxalase superfamily protein PhnB